MHLLYEGLQLSIIYDPLEKKRASLHCEVRNSLSWSFVAVASCISIKEKNERR